MLELIKQLRERTGASLQACKKALEEANGNEDQAIEILRKKGEAKAASRGDRETHEGVVSIAQKGNKAIMVHLACETDFVARTDDFKKLIREIAMQAAAMKPESTEVLLEQDYIRDSSKKIKDLIIELTAKVGENIVIKDFKVLEV